MRPNGCRRQEWSWLLGAPMRTAKIWGDRQCKREAAAASRTFCVDIEKSCATALGAKVDIWATNCESAWTLKGGGERKEHGKGNEARAVQRPQHGAATALRKNGKRTCGQIGVKILSDREGQRSVRAGGSCVGGSRRVRLSCPHSRTGALRGEGIICAAGIQIDGIIVSTRR